MSEFVVRTEMEMPKSCADCDIATKYQRFGTEIYCPFMGWYADYDKCPIILQLPEKHGRLVDINIVAKRMKDAEELSEFCDEFEFGGRWTVDLSKIPTIVPATEVK